MKINHFLAIIALAFVTLPTVKAQKYMTRTGTINFESRAEVDDDVRAVNKSVNCALDATTGDIVFMVLVKSFEFKKALMQEHFNENYMESEKFPKAIFKGKIDNLSAINFSKDGTYDAVVSGDLTIHGVTKKVTQKGKIKVAGSNVTLLSDFQVALADYNIEIPSMVAEKISKDIFINCNLLLTLSK